MDAEEIVSGASAVLDEADRLTSRGEWRAAVDLLEAARRDHAEPVVEERLVHLRHSAFAHEAVGSRDPTWPSPVPDHFVDIPQGTLPDVPYTELTADLLASGLQHHGALVVRGLLDRPQAAQLLDDTRRAFDADEAAVGGAPVGDTSPWYRPFEPDEGHSFGFFERYATRSGGGVLMAESPRLLGRVIDVYRSIGLGDLLAEYLGEWPALSVKKSTLRRATPQSGDGWHQDGQFLGEGVHTVNVWTSLTAAGVDAPGVDMFAVPFDHIVRTGTEGAPHQWSVSPAEAARYGVENIARPSFEPGDALMFNQMSLHTSAVDPAMTEDRYALEAWFFGPSSYPMAQVPLVF